MHKTLKSWPFEPLEYGILGGPGNGMGNGNPD